MQNQSLSSAATAAAAFCLLISLLTGTPAAAQGTGDGVAGLFGEVIDVRVVNLEVVVTDPEGRRVHGLGPEDFVLRVDRRPVPIEFFTEVRDGAARTAERETEVSAVPALDPGGAVKTHYLVFIDEYFAIGRDRDRAVDDLIAQLPSLGAADRMAILAWNGGKLEMLSNWSGSESDLRLALESSKERPTSGLQHEMAMRRTTLDPRTGRVPYDNPYRDPQNRHRADRLKDRAERVMRAATTAMRSFARPPGRKTMLLLAGGWPYNPWDVVVPNFRPGLFSPSLDYGPCLYRQLYDTANRLGYTLYTVDLRSFAAGVMGSAAHRSMSEAQYARDLTIEREFSEHSTLMLLAEQTGGKAFLNRRGRTALEQVVADTRSYYWLGFSPDWQGGDRRHRVEIEVRDPGLEVRSRQSFSDLSRRTEVDMTVESALLFGDPPGPNVLAARLGKPESAGFRKVVVPLAVAVSLDALTFLPQSEGWAARVELRIAVEDKHGDRNELGVNYVNFTTPEAPVPGAVGRAGTVLKMRRLRHDVVVSIHDPLSGRILWTRLEFDPRT